jgi:Putative prokaryotic signal transducing protein
MAATSDLILAYHACDSVEARALAARFADAGIDAQVLGESLQGAYGGINAGNLNSVEVWIPSADRSEAESVIAEWRQIHFHPRSNRKEPSTVSPPVKLQYSTLVLLWVMTAVAILAAATSLRLISFHDWPGGMVSLLLLPAFIDLFIKGVRRLTRWVRRCTRDVPGPRISSSNRPLDN